MKRLQKLASSGNEKSGTKPDIDGEPVASAAMSNTTYISIFIKAFDTTRLDPVVGGLVQSGC